MVTITITYFLYLVTAGIILLFFAILAIGKDFKILDSNYIDNIIGIAALIFGIVSIPRVKEWLGRRLSERKAIKKLWYIIIILFLTANYAQTECQFRYCGTAIPFFTVRSTAR